jgi:hypothetical protein
LNRYTGLEAEHTVESNILALAESEEANTMDANDDDQSDDGNAWEDGEEGDSWERWER